MRTVWNKKVLTVLMRWEYCDPRRGISGEKACFHDNIAALTGAAEGFWYDEYASEPVLLRSKLLEAAEKFQPDLIFFNPFTHQLDPGFLDSLKARWPTCAWFGDDTWRFDHFSSRLAPHFTHVLTTDPFSVRKYNGIGIRPILTQWAAQPYSGISAPLSPGEKFPYDVSFVGAYNQVRGWFVKTLRGFGVKTECFGQGWPNGKVSSEDVERIFRGSRISLNLSNSVPRDIRFVLGGFMNFARFVRSRKTAEQIKARNFEIPLAGGFQLTNYVAGLERYLRIGEEVAAYSSPAECAQQIGYYLTNSEERFLIAKAGWKRAVAEHTYRHRFADIFRAIWGGD